MNNPTSDNSHYRSLNQAPWVSHVTQLQLIAQSEITSSLPQPVREYMSASVADASRRAFSSDLKRFLKWGGIVPCAPEMIAVYFADHGETHSIATLRRWGATLSKVHRMAGHLDPTKQEPVVSTLRGICRTHGKVGQEAQALLRDDLFSVLDLFGKTVRDKRDRALLLTGFAGGFRRSEIVSLNTDDVEFVRRGMVITLRRSKTDQLAVGRRIGIPFGKGRHCPVSALEGWLETGSFSAGPIFRPVNRSGKIFPRRLSCEAVSIIVKDRVEALGFEPAGYSGHSLRAGFVTSAAQAGVSSWKIRQQTGHASDAMLARYIRSAELFEANAAGAVL